MDEAVEIQVFAGDVEAAVEVELDAEVQGRRRELEDALLAIVAAEDAIAVPVERLMRLFHYMDEGDDDVE